MKDLRKQEGDNLTGSLLVAHPALLDPNFVRSVVLLSVHSAEEGALGVVLNRPMNRKLGDIDEAFRFSPLAEVPVFRGGPVGIDRILLVAWKWTGSGEGFELFFGIDEEKARQFVETDPAVRVRAFLGHSGWSAGQLESELEQDSWTVSPIVPELDKADGAGLWRLITKRLGPKMRLMADAPDDPSKN